MALTGSASDQQSTNDRKVAGSRHTKVVCITVLTGNRIGWTARCGRPPLLLPSCRKLEFRLSALMDSYLAWVNGKSGRQSWRYADALQRSIISEAIYHLPFVLYNTHNIPYSYLSVNITFLSRAACRLVCVCAYVWLVHGCGIAP